MDHRLTVVDCEGAVVKIKRTRYVVHPLTHEITKIFPRSPIEKGDRVFIEGLGRCRVVREPRYDKTPINTAEEAIEAAGLYDEQNAWQYIGGSRCVLRGPITVERDHRTL